jgi:tellurite resistance protein TerC
MLIWSLFLLLILALLALDLGVLNRKAHVIHPKEALAWTGFWVALALAFNVFVYVFYDKAGWGLAPGMDFSLGGQEAALEFFAAYLLEKSLSLDNIFVIAMIFGFFKIPAIYQHRVLFWGILGALVMRGIMIALGAALIHQFSWVTYIFGAILLITAVKMLLQRDDNFDPEHNWLIRLARRFMPATTDMAGGHFLTKINGVTHITPLFLVLLMVETTDLLFAVDSIPAVFAVTQDPFIVFTSNVFAILGLRSLYFALAGLMDKFRYLKISLVFILAYVAVKMLLVHHYPIPIPVTLGVIGGILVVGIAASVIGGSKDPAALTSPLEGELRSMATLDWRQARRIAAILFGSTLILMGAVMLLIPGPGIPAILGGLVILSSEFVWARTLLRKVRERVGNKVPLPGVEKLDEKDQG